MTERAEAELASLYIPLYFDEDVSADIVNNLLTRGFDVLSARDEGMLRKSDDEQMAHAVVLRRAIVTHNRVHFEEQHRKFLETGRKHYGIIIARRRPKDAEVVAKLLALLNISTAAEMENQVRYI